MKAREETDFVCLYELEWYTGICVRGANDAVICGIELKLNIIADFSLSHVWHEGMTALCFLIRLLSIAVDGRMTEVRRTFATATVRVIGCLLEVEEAELEGAAAAVTL